MTNRIAEGHVTAVFNIKSYAVLRDQNQSKQNAGKKQKSWESESES